MKAYQVYTGDLSKHGHQYYELHSTYFSKETALEKCKELVALHGYESETVVESEWWNGDKCKSWDVIGWEIVTICKLEEIQITGFTKRVMDLENKTQN
jgi:hypothetical protein